MSASAASRATRSSLRCGERDRPREVPDGEVRRRREHEAGRAAETERPMGERVAREPARTEGQHGEGEREGEPVRERRAGRAVTGARSSSAERRRRRAGRARRASRARSARSPGQTGGEHRHGRTPAAPVGRPRARAASTARAKNTTETVPTSRGLPRPTSRRSNDARRRAASATAVAASAPTSASLWPPPAEWTASTGFQPTNAAASAGWREVRDKGCDGDEDPGRAERLEEPRGGVGRCPATRATGSETAVNAGP